MLKRSVLLFAPIGIIALGALALASNEPSYPVQTTPLTGGEGTVEQFDHNAYSTRSCCADMVSNPPRFTVVSFRPPPFPA